MDETPKKKNLPRRLIAAVCSAALVLGAVALVLYRDGKVLNSIVAPESKAAIDAFIQNNLNM